MWPGSAGRSCAGWTACCRNTLCGMGQTPDDMLSAVSASLAQRTGRPLDEWVALVRASGIGPLDQNAVRKWLRSSHGIPQNSQWAIADAAARDAGWVRPTVAEYVDGQYSGPKAALRPVYDALAAAIGDLGGDVTVEGRSTYTPFVRGRQFAAVAAATRDRVGSRAAFHRPAARWKASAGHRARAGHPQDLPAQRAGPGRRGAAPAAHRLRAERLATG